MKQNVDDEKTIAYCREGEIGICRLFIFQAPVIPVIVVKIM